MQRKVVEENDESTKVKEKEIDKVNKVPFHSDDIQDACSTSKEKEEKDETDHENDSKLKCTLCNYPILDTRISIVLRPSGSGYPP